jgi:DNA-3-methyladenine glycosylase II
MITDRNPLIKKHIQNFIESDDLFAKYFDDYRSVDRETGNDGMDGLIHIVIGQQVSTAAAAAMRHKFIDKFGFDNPQGILNADDETLKYCGLSRQKIGYVRGLAQAVIDGTTDIDSWATKPTPTIIDEITSLKGFGLWSAQMYLIFNLCRPDVWPQGDLGVQKGLGIYLGLDAKPTEKETLVAGAQFKDRETAAALLVWRIKDDVS